MTEALLDARAFEPRLFGPLWQRPAVVAIVVALHALALATLPHLARKLSEPVTEVIVDIQPEAAPAEPTPPAPEAPKETEATTEPTPSPLPPPQDLAPLPAEPPPVAEAPPLEQQPPEPPPAAPIEQPPLPAPEPPPPAPVELAPPKPPPTPPKIEARKPAERPAPARAQPWRAPAEEARTAPPTSASASSAAGAASMSAYTGEVSAAIRSRMFYPPAARARQARGVVGVAFTIGASGAVTSFSITRSSGDNDLDAAARTLVRTTRFPPPPGGSAHISTSFNYVPG